MLRLTQSSSLSASCSRLLLQITSSLLLGENVTLPNALIQETVQKVCVCVKQEKGTRHLFVCSRVLYMCGVFVCLHVPLCFLHKVFGSTMGQDLILEFTKEMFTMKQFEQVE